MGDFALFYLGVENVNYKDRETNQYNQTRSNGNGKLNDEASVDGSQRLAGFPMLVEGNPRRGPRSLNSC